MQESAVKAERKVHRNFGTKDVPFGSLVWGATHDENSEEFIAYQELRQFVVAGKSPSEEVVKKVANSLVSWAVSHEVTHYTHWFQPLNGCVAGKHESFLTPTSAPHLFGIDNLTSDALVQGESDASSFPNGGLRSTDQARGYTIWDPSAEIVICNYGASKVLHIPAVFLSYTGEALDNKTVLLKSSNLLSDASVELLQLLGKSKGDDRVYATLGAEQEFFLVPRALAIKRPDLLQSGRTLFGGLPPKHQQLEDHYFGSIPSRTLKVMEETEETLNEMGIALRARHNEVAPCQYEITCMHTDANRATDQNLLLMETLKRAAKKNEMMALFHEKPFKGVNGSGKHCNWSLALASTGENLLSPGPDPSQNVVFITFLVAVIAAIYRYGYLLRSAVTTCANEHRLGAQEAPPAIISVFLGTYLSELLDDIEKCQMDVDAKSKTPLEKIVFLPGLPEFKKDRTDRNRTSPFAFTGDKFEFRAVGSSQSPSFPVAILNAIVTWSVRDISSKIKATGDSPSKKQIFAVLAKLISETKAIRFEGNGYSTEWHEEAEKRELKILKTTPDSLKALVLTDSVDLLTKFVPIFTEKELVSRYDIFFHQWHNQLLIEAKSMAAVFDKTISPAVMDYMLKLSKLCSADGNLSEEVFLTQLIQLERLVNFATSKRSALLTASLLDLETAMGEFRKAVDELEAAVPNWPLPSYEEFFSQQ